MKKIVALVLMLAMLLCCGVEAFAEYYTTESVPEITSSAPDSAPESAPEPAPVPVRDTVTIVVGAEPEAEENNPATGAPVFLGLMVACAVCGAFVLKRKN